MLNRRSILGLIAGAPVAAQAMPQAGATGAPVGYGLNSAGVIGGLNKGLSTDWIKGRVAEIRKELGEIGKDKAERIAQIRRDITHIDPDLAAMRSFSDERKRQIQAERNYERDVANHKTWLTRQIEELLQQSGTKSANPT